MFTYLIKKLYAFPKYYRNAKSLLIRFILYLDNRVAKQTKSKKSRRVAFMMFDLPFWKSDSLYRQMESSSKFTPCVWLLKQSAIVDKNLQEQVLSKSEEYLKKENYKYYKTESLQEFRKLFNPDYIFVVQPYDNQIPFEIHDLSNELLCYIPYSLAIRNVPVKYNNRKQQTFHRNYVESHYIRKYAKSVMANAGSNLRITRLPIIDDLLRKRNENAWQKAHPNMKKIIWAPHWTVNNDVPSSFVVSTFLTVSEKMLSVAEELKNKVFFSFKPHPSLKRTLYKNALWGKDRTDAYYKAWSDLENAQLDEGDYVALFQQSDAMIHDSGSFIMEYLIMNKPCMYLNNGKLSQEYNQPAIDALSCYEHGRDIEDINSFINRIITNIDTKKEEREKFIESYLMQTSDSHNIINILDDL